MKSDKLADYTIEANARRLANMLQEFWVRKGANNVRFYVVPLKQNRDNRQEIIYTIKSNLQNGLPPG